MLENTELEIMYRPLTLLSKLVLLANESYPISTMLTMITEYVSTYPQELNTNYLRPLTVAIYKGNLRVINLLLDHEANVKHISLHELASLTKISVIELLVKRKVININEKDYSGHTILMYRIHNSSILRFEAVKLFLELGADNNIKNSYQETATEWAIKHLERDGIKMIELMLKYDASISQELLSKAGLQLVKRNQTLIKNKFLKIVKDIDMLNAKN